jgi:hypothetical protein
MQAGARQQPISGAPPRGQSAPQCSQDRKQGRRNKQAATLAKKGQEEVVYFQQCVKEAARGGTAAAAKSESDLFAKQGSHGINFDTYGPIAQQRTAILL